MSDALDAPAERPTTARAAMRAAVAGCLALAGAGGWLGGPAGALMAVAAGLLLAWLMRARHRAGTPSADTLQAGVTAGTDAHGDLQGPDLMIRQVLPVWQRQLVAARDLGDGGMQQLLQAFSQIHEVLGGITDQLEHFKPAAAPGAIGDAIDLQQPALDALRAPAERAFAERDRLVATLAGCGQVVGLLQQVSKELRELGRHTRLVAFNASIEAHRGQQQASGGSQQVAAEVRSLSEGVIALCDRLDSHLLPLAEATTEGFRQGWLGDTSPEELRLETDRRAREALEALITGLGSALQGAHHMREAGADLRQRMDDIFVHFQFGDRLTQMLDILNKDVARFEAWVPRHPQATLADAKTWLTELEGRYTTDEQRAQHHSTGHVDRGSEVEFF